MLTGSILSIGLHSHNTLVPYHHGSFIHRCYLYTSPVDQKARCFYSSVVVPSPSKHPFVQICVGIDEDLQLPQYLFFAEEYGFPTAILCNDQLQILYGSADWLHHSEVLSLYSGLLEDIAYRVKASLEHLKTNAHSMLRQVCIGGTNSIGHNLINDINGLRLISELIKKNQLNAQFCHSDHLLFDSYAATYFSEIYDVPLAAHCIDTIKSHGAEFVPFMVRPFGYGFGTKEKLALGISKSAQYSLWKQSELIWVSIRSPHEERHNPKIYDLTLKKLIEIAQTEVQLVICFDGVTAIVANQTNLASGMALHMKAQIRIVEWMKQEISAVLPKVKIYSVIGLKLSDKIEYAKRVKYWLGPYGSGSWPIWFMPGGEAFLYIQQPLRTLKTEPTYDYIAQEHNVRICPIYVDS